jgi:hypothetical protein
MKIMQWAALGALAAMMGCTDDAHVSAPAAEATAVPEASGTVQLKLTGADSAGRTYRLREASFQVIGYPYFGGLLLPGMPYPYDAGSPLSELYLSTEDDPDLPMLTARVIPGQYTVSLLGSSWYLERSADSGWERVEQAVLLSEATQFAYVWNGGITPVNFSFGVDGELIDFRAGDIQIGITIERPGDADAGMPWPYDGGMVRYD